MSDQPPPDDEKEGFDPDAYLEGLKSKDGLKQTTPSAARSGAIGFAQGGTFGFADELGAAYMKLAPKWLGGIGEGVRLGKGATEAAEGDTEGVRALKERLKAWQETQPTTYEMSRDILRNEDAAAREANPWAYRAGTLAGAVATAPLLPGAGQAGRGVTLLAKPGQSLATNLGKLAVSGMKTGAAGGGLAGLGYSTEESVPGMLKDAAIGATVGTVLGGVLPVAVRGGQGVARGVKWAGDKVASGIIEPTAAAQALRAKGVPLTVGQMNPSSKFGAMEEISTSTAGVGDLIKTQRADAADAWRRLVINEARPPGMAELPIARGRDAISGQVDEIARGFDADTAYGALDDLRVQPERHLGGGKWQTIATDDSIVGAAKTKGIFDLATAKGNGIMAKDATRQEVADWLASELTILPRGAQKNGMTADALNGLRSNIRRQIRHLTRGNATTEDLAAAAMLKRAESGVTELMEAQLPAEAVAALRASDAQYAKFGNLLDTVARTGDQPAGFMPQHLSASVKSGTNTNAYARGGGGPMRELAQLGKDTIEAQVPKTGVQTLFGLPVVKHLNAPASYWLNTPTGKRFALGETGLQEWLRKPGVMSAVGNKIGRASELASSAVRDPQAAITRTIQPERLGSVFPLAGTAQSEPQRPVGVMGRYMGVLEKAPQLLGRYGAAIAKEKTLDGRLAMSEALAIQHPEFAAIRDELLRRLGAIQTPPGPTAEAP